MFIAVRPLTVDGKRINPGEEVPGFETWDLTIRRAHLNLEWVRIEEPEDKPKPKGKKSKKQGG